MGAALLSPCNRFLAWDPEEVYIQKMLKRALEFGGMRLTLARSAEMSGNVGQSALTVWRPGQQILAMWVEWIESVDGWDPLRRRFLEPSFAHESDIPRGKDCETDIIGNTLCGPSDQARTSKSRPASRSFWRAKIAFDEADAPPGAPPRSFWCILQIASAIEERRIECTTMDIQSAKKLAGHADSFNAHIKMAAVAEADGCDVDVESMPCVTVSVPTGCRVVQSPVPQFFCPGDEIVLYPYRADCVSKFVYDSTEMYVDLPQTFFHYVTWRSNGEDLITDLQGVEGEDGSVLLVCPSASENQDRGDGGIHGGLISSLVNVGMPFATSHDNRDGASPNAILTHLTSSTMPVLQQALFDRLHPRCSLLCRTFDPERKSAKFSSSRHRACGFGKFGCG